MLKTPRFIHVTDAPVRLGDGGVLDHEHIVTCGSLIGRVLFTEQCAVEVEGHNATISNCVIESMTGAAIRITAT